MRSGWGGHCLFRLDGHPAENDQHFTERNRPEHTGAARQTGILSLLERLFKVLKTDGVMVMSHYMFQLDLNWGYPPGLWDNLIPITRKWIKEGPGYKEVFFDGFDPHWWIFYQNV